MDRALPLHPEILFLRRRPSAVLGTPCDVLVHGTGRVVRCSLSQNLYSVAAIVDEFRLDEE